MAAFGKPENALKRAKELIAVNQKTQALQVMHEVLSSKKHRQWQEALEEIMKKYIKLSVEMRQQKRAKDGLHQYRMICSQTHLASLEKVIRYFLKVADKYARDAQSKADKIVVDLSKIEDLDAEDATDSLLSATTQDDTKDRTDREIVTPWLKFLWETYRTVLEILRNNQTLEALYQETAQQAYNFCLKYKRTTEFRRLAELLRNHLFQVKSPNQQQPVTLSSPESLNLHLETRFVQLNVAMELELWQEAFRSIEDIHGLITLAKKAPKPQLMASYYQKLTQIFWVSNNHLFHAYAWYKHYALTKAHKQNLTADEIRLMTSSVLLAALSIPIPSKRNNDHYLDVDVQKEKNTRLAALLGFSINPKRDVLLAELASKNISALVLPELKDLYNLLEKKFHPLELCAAVKPKLDFIAAHPTLSQYHKPLEKLLFTRLLQQLSKVYQVMKLSELQRLASFADAQSVERWTIEAVKQGHIEARIDHQTRAISFGSQVLESEKMRSQLTELSKNLQVVVEMLHPEASKAREEKKRAVFAQLVQGAEEEHKRILARKANIEKRKELQELLEKIKAREEADRRDAAAAAALAAAVRAEPSTEAPVAKGTLDVAVKEVDPRQDALDKIKKARQALDKKMTKLARRLDYLERARRMAEKPILEASIEKQKTDDAAFLEEQMKTTLERHKSQHQLELEEKKRLSRMVAYKSEFEARVMKRREEEFAKAKATQDARMADVRANIEKLREKRRISEEKKKADEERMRKQREEEDRQRREADEKRRAEESARQKKLEEQADQQRRREQEVLDKQRGAPTSSGGAYRPPADRERERDGPYRPPADRSDRDGPYRPPADRERERERDGPYRPPASSGGAYRPPGDRERPREDEGGWRREGGASRPPADRERAGPPSSGGSYRPPGARDERRDDYPPRRDDYPPRRDDYPPRRDDYPPRRDDYPPRRDDYPSRPSEGGAYRPPIDRDRERNGPPSSGGAYRPPGARDERRDDYPPRRDERRDDYPPRRDERRDERRDDYPPRRDEPRGGGGAPPAGRSAPEPRKDTPPPPSTDDDGFTTVKRGARPVKK